MEPRSEVATMHVVPQPQHARWFSTPTTHEGWLAAVLALLAFAFGVIGEAARQGDVPGPFYAVALTTGLFGGAAAVLAVRRGERSLLAMVALLPFLLEVSFGLAELLG
jgi:hypothetical protein